MIITILLAVTLVLAGRFSPLHRETVHQYASEHEYLLRPETQHFPVHSTKVTQTVKEVNVSSSSINSPCQSNISQRGSGCFNIIEALSNLCTESEGYEISLLDPKHVEHLEVNINASILIKGCNTNQTIWSIDSQNNGIINLVQGDLTINNIEFQFTTIDIPVSYITPSNWFIYGGRQGYSTSLIVNECIFQSTSGLSRDSMIQIVVIDSKKVEISKSVFNGLNYYQPSSISMIFADNCSYVSVKKCKFQDAFIVTTQSAVELQTKVENGSVIVEECEFINIISNRYPLLATLKVRGDIKFKATINRNNFTNCSATDSYSGALYVVDSSHEDISEYIITNNIFRNNSGNNAGAIYLNSLNPKSKFNFNNNIFSMNKNNVTDSIGCDVNIVINYYSYNQTSNITGDVIKNWFKGSTTDSVNESIHYETYQDGNITESGNLSLPNSSGKSMNIGLIIGIVVGSVIFVSAIIVTIIIVVVLYKRKKSMYIKAGQMSESLLLGPQQDSI